MRDWISGDWIAAIMSRDRRSITAAGVPAGTLIPCHP